MKERNFSFSSILGVGLLIAIVALFLSLDFSNENNFISQISTPQSSDYVLDEYPGARAAYSLRQLSSNYSGPAIQVRRSSDNQTVDVSFNNRGELDTAPMLAFVGSSDGYIERWYNQIEGNPDLVQSSTDRQPMIVDSGELITDESGKPTLFFDGSDEGDGEADFLRSESFSESFSLNNYSFYVVLGEEPGTRNSGSGETYFAGIWDNHGWDGTALRGTQTYINTSHVRFGDEAGSLDMEDYSFFLLRNTGSLADVWQGNTLKADRTLAEDDELNIANEMSHLNIGYGFEGNFSEFVVYPEAVSDETIEGLYVNNTSLGPTSWNENALLPQTYQYQVDIYDWLETINISDVTLPEGTLEWDGHYSNISQLSDLWLYFTPHGAATLSRVTRQDPRWLVLDDGNGHGIEATGVVRLLHGTGGNHRSWGNEPAYWYQLSLPMANGSNGNPYYHEEALCNRALVITAVDMLKYDEAVDNGTSLGWNDMHGKALLSWAQAVYACKDEMSADLLADFEAGFKRHLEISIESGVRDANTNMDMFPVEAAGLIAGNTNNSDLANTALRTVKRLLLGYADGELGVKHDVMEGAFYPAGYVGENDMPEFFYNGESFLHVVGALAYTNGMPGWGWLEEVVSKMSDWILYQGFPDPAFTNEGGDVLDREIFNGGAGYSGRTGNGFPSGQAGYSVWKYYTSADIVEEGEPFINNLSYGTSGLPENASDMVSDIQRDVRGLQDEFGVTYSETPPEWSGWSPWIKSFPYYPPSGWYSRLKSLEGTENATIPVNRSGTYSKAFGGYPTGMEFWSYKGNDGDTDFGWFIEADAHQGVYGGWYGGKIETFWTRPTGIILLNRHGKTGCDAGDREDSTCWDMVDRRGAHHVWGRDENGNAFSTLQLRGRELRRTAEYTPNNSPQSVEVVNYFNDPSVNIHSNDSGEETGDEIQGDFSITNKFEALNNGIKVTHTLESDGTDELSEIWASLPIYLGDARRNSGQPDTTIDYWNGSSWETLTTSLTQTSKLRIGRDFLTGDGPQYAYVILDESRGVKLSSSVYQDPYQTDNRIRQVHIDMHGSPGTSRTFSGNTSVYYSIVTTNEESSSVVSEEPSIASPVSPTISSPTVLSSGSIRWNFTDNASNEDGFRLYGPSGLIDTSVSQNISSIIESGLSENTLYSGRYVTAYNDGGESSDSSNASSVYTLADNPTNFITSSVTRNRIRLTVDSFPNDSSGSSGYYFSNQTTGESSGWINQNSWNNSGLDCETLYTYEVKYRNGDGLETNPSSLTISTSDCSQSQVQGECQDADEDGILDYHPTQCQDGTDQCVVRRSEVSNLNPYHPTSNNFNLQYNQEEDIRDLPNFRIEKQNQARVQFEERVDLLRLNGNNGCFTNVNIDDIVEIGERRVSIDSDTYSEFDKPAEVTFYNIDLSNPVIKKDGEVCSSPECRIVNYNREAGTITIEVQGFSEYTVEEGAVCGNGIIEVEEICDDNNSSNGDGCSSQCTVESGYTCSGEPSSCEEESSGVVSSGGGGGGGYVQDTAAPYVQNVELSVSATSTRINWETNEESISWIVYGTSTSYSEEIKTGIYKDSHSILLSNLSASTTYHYQIKTRDDSGNSSLYEDKIFTTTDIGEKTNEYQEDPKEEEEKSLEEMSISELKEKIAQLIKMINSLKAQLGVIESTDFSRIPYGFRFNNNLWLGLNSNEVKYLQIFLNEELSNPVSNSGWGSPGYESIYFGPSTRNALIRFQDKYKDSILIPLGYKNGTGYFGPSTRSKINKILESAGR